ncbi:wax ester/triacylglycerol synthase family O-acyltransferase [Skermania sp. ID1734]|uniref:WS/DGAT/MGAT family O-acyltransferase n=1 Tax=Skermania sp. ID1734 TaxID=2597516 RepID=UPI0011811FC3|nr:wax ester/triacylglycerol synthase family O-acyltransferase [Skermania sp. ID1734]TSD97336.1 wax ester/triacylglycerol synthase family O-acyltransferase [Skermania sp. ID1734]
MVTRLTPDDASFLELESSSSPVHIGSLAIADNTSGALTYENLVDIVSQRLCLVPRYRQKVRQVPFGLARPVWVDDADFDVSYHIRRSALPNPGTDEQLFELVARLSSRPLDTSRPLWEIYLVEGLSDNRVAIFTKSHSALVDGADALEIGHVILDASRQPQELADDLWMPMDGPTESALAMTAVAELLTNPGQGMEFLRRTAGGVGETARTVERSLSRFVSALHTATRATPSSPLNTDISHHRRFAAARTNLADYRKIRARFGCTINDAILTVLTGALRNWLFSRGEPITESSTVRALVPMSVYVSESAADQSSEVSSFLVDLPVGEPNPVIRLSHVSHANAAHGRQRRGVRARTLVRLSGFAPASLHAMSVRSAFEYAERAFNLMITNAPGPQSPMFIAGARMLEMYPVSPLLKNQALSIGLTSYDGSVFYGFHADRDAMADVDLISTMLYESLEELLDACA